MKKIVKILNLESNRRGINNSALFEQMLDFFIGTFDPSLFVSYRGDISDIFSRRQEDDPQLFSLMIEWIERSKREIAANGAYDFLGRMYESLFLSKSKASAMGQFFTPDVLSQLMANTIDTESAENVNEPSCGSGRNVIWHWANADKSRPPYYKCEDLDPISVKMCALNMMIHGMIGEVICHDTLDTSGAFHFKYMINEIRHPFPSPFYSIRKMVQ